MGGGVRSGRSWLRRGIRARSCRFGFGLGVGVGGEVWGGWIGVRVWVRVGGVGDGDGVGGIGLECLPYRDDVLESVRRGRNQSGDVVRFRRRSLHHHHHHHHHADDVPLAH